MRYRTVVPGTFLVRRNRFVAEIETAGRRETVHVKNTGRCRELLVPGALVTPCDRQSRIYPEPLTAAKLLRRAVDSTGGILIYESSSLDGDSLSACAEVSRIMEQYEAFIRFGKRLGHSLPGWPEEDIQVIEHDGRKVLFLMNSSGKARTYRGKQILPGKVLVEELRES